MEAGSFPRVGAMRQGVVSVGFTKACLSGRTLIMMQRGRGVAASWEPGMPLNGNFGSAGF